jgi:hypothetical protein
VPKFLQKKIANFSVSLSQYISFLAVVLVFQ